MASVLTLLPPTLGLASKPGGSNGKNGPFFAIYWTGHPRAAAIAAHEVREARFKMPALLVAGIAGAGLAYLASPFVTADPIARVLFYVAGVLLGWLVVHAIPAMSRATNFRGEAVEIVVERDWYDQDEVRMIEEGARQLGSYSGAPEDFEERVNLLLDLLPDAEQWASRNRRLIDRAFRSQASGPA